MLTVRITSEEVRFFDERFAQKTGEHQLKSGAIFFHGWQREQPIINNYGSFWVSTDRTTSAGYAQQGLARGCESGILTLRLVHDITLPKFEIGGLLFLNTFYPSHLDHRIYSNRLHQWAMLRGIDGVYGGEIDIVFFKAGNYLNVVQA